MADATFDIALTNPATPTFADVARTNYYYQYIEGAHAVGLVNGVTTSTFAPFSTLTREQAIAIIARAVAAEQDFDLASLTSAEISVALGPFHDAASVSTSLRDEMAFAVIEGITQGTDAGNLAPQAAVARIVGATLLIRAESAQPVVPTVTAISPTGGSYLGGTSVVITGTSFATASNVMFGTVAAASFTVNSDTQITAVAPAGTSGTTVDVMVTNVAGTSAVVAADKYTYGIVPTVTVITPTAGKVGDVVNIYGTNFTGATMVKFGTVAATNFIVNTPGGTIINATVPAGTGTVDVTVSNAVGSSAIVAGDQFTYPVLPTVTAVSPTGGLQLVTTNVVTITGTGFTGVLGVMFGATAATNVVVSGSTAITCNAPSIAAGVPVDVTVVTTNGTSLTSIADHYTFFAVPGVTFVNGVAPFTGKANTTVVITGAGFTGATAVTFGATPATSFIVTSATTISATVPAGTAGATVPVNVTNLAGTGTLALGFTYTPFAIPTVIGLTPAFGEGGDTVTITGTVFTFATAVKFGGVAASFIINNATTISATVPATLSLGATVGVTVTNADGTSAVVAASKFFVNAPPVVYNATPLAGAHIGDTVTITGSGFSGLTSVTFIAVPAVVIHYYNDNLISVVVPAGTALGANTINVTSPAGTATIAAYTIL